MDIISFILDPTILAVCFLGALVGTFIGVMPGVGPATGAALFFATLNTNFPIEYTVIILTSVLYGAQFGGSTGAILFRLPGEGSSAVTCIDGYAMAQKGEAQKALFVAAFASLIGGLVSLAFIIVMGKAAMSAAMMFSALHYLCMFIIVICLMLISMPNTSHNIISLMIGGLIGLIGTVGGQQRLTFGMQTLNDGVDLTIFVMCLFGVAEILYTLIKGESHYPIKNILSNTIDWKVVKQSLFPSIRGSLVGLLTIIPGFSFVTTTLLSYKLEHSLAKDKDSFGKGAVAGIAAPEAANNAGAQVTFLPLFLLGIPTGSVTALLGAAMSASGLVPGPSMLANDASLLYRILVSVLIVNVFLVVLNWPLVKIWAKILTFNTRLVYMCVLCLSVLCIVATTSSSDIIIVCILIVLCLYLISKKYSSLYVFMGFVFIPEMDEYLIRSIQIMKYKPVLPIDIGFMLSTVLVVALLIGLKKFYKNA